MIQQRLAGALAQQGNAGAILSMTLSNGGNGTFGAFGSIGPDFLFFSMREYGLELQDFTNFIFGVYDALEPFGEFYEKTIEPVVETVEAIGTDDRKY